jgi:FkbM family methyltransferase
MYFPGDLFELTPEEAFVDCGAYDGDTLEVFLKESGGHFRKYWALEPDPINFRKLQANCAALLASDTRISTFQLASGAREGRLSFVADGSDAARVASAGAQDSVEVDAVSLDTFLEGQQVTFLKMDIEGSEIDALEGAARVIRDDAPVLGICAYHRQDDIWKIPLLIKRLNPHYDFFLRPHKQEVWDLVCYAIPSKRLKNA